jgi:hypothetical protein
MATNKPRHGYERKRSQLKTKTMGQKHWTKRSRETGTFMDQKKAGKIQVGASGKERQIACMMRPVITSIKAELRSKGLDRRQCCWHVSYQFCGLSAEITVYAENEAEARTKAVNQLRQRGLNVA